MQHSNVALLAPTSRIKCKLRCISFETQMGSSTLITPSTQEQTQSRDREEKAHKITKTKDGGTIEATAEDRGDGLQGRVRN